MADRGLIKENSEAFPTLLQLHFSPDPGGDVPETIHRTDDPFITLLRTDEYLQNPSVRTVQGVPPLGPWLIPGFRYLCDDRCVRYDVGEPI